MNKSEIEFANERSNKMSDLISKSAVIEMLHYNCDESCSSVVRDVENLASVDAVEVVRCKNCKWIANPYCPLFKHPTHSYDDYCSYGERKEASE